MAGMTMTPVELFSRSRIAPKLKYHQPFGCPVYVLHNSLQAPPMIHDKWTECTRVVVYLGRSPQHHRSIALVLNLATGHVSPQFHLRFDPSFHAVRQSFGETPPVSQWQAKCGFTTATTTKRSTAPSEQQVPVTTQHSPSATAAPEGDTAAPVADAPAADVPETTTPSADGDQFTQPSVASLPPLRRSTRPRRPVERYTVAFGAQVSQGYHEEGELLSYQALCPSMPSSMDGNPLMAMAASADPDVMYLHEAM